MENNCGNCIKGKARDKFLNSQMEPKPVLCRTCNNWSNWKCLNQDESSESVKPIIKDSAMDAHIKRIKDNKDNSFRETLIIEAMKIFLTRVFEADTGFSHETRMKAISRDCVDLADRVIKEKNKC